MDPTQPDSTELSECNTPERVSEDTANIQSSNPHIQQYELEQETESLIPAFFDTESMFLDFTSQLINQRECEVDTQSIDTTVEELQQELAELEEYFASIDQSYHEQAPYLLSPLPPYSPPRRNYILNNPPLYQSNYLQNLLYFSFPEQEQPLDLSMNVSREKLIDDSQLEELIESESRRLPDEQKSIPTIITRNRDHMSLMFSDDDEQPVDLSFKNLNNVSKTEYLFSSPLNVTDGIGMSMNETLQSPFLFTTPPNLCRVSTEVTPSGNRPMMSLEQAIQTTPSTTKTHNDQSTSSTTSNQVQNDRVMYENRRYTPLANNTFLRNIRDEEALSGLLQVSQFISTPSQPNIIYMQRDRQDESTVSSTDEYDTMRKVIDLARIPLPQFRDESEQADAPDDLPFEDALEDLPHTTAKPLTTSTSATVDGKSICQTTKITRTTTTSASAFFTGLDLLSQNFVPRLIGTPLNPFLIDNDRAIFPSSSNRTPALLPPSVSSLKDKQNEELQNKVNILLTERNTMEDEIKQLKEKTCRQKERVKAQQKDINQLQSEKNELKDKLQKQKTKLEQFHLLEDIVFKLSLKTSELKEENNCLNIEKKQLAKDIDALFEFYSLRIKQNNEENGKDDAETRDSEESIPGLELGQIVHQNDIVNEDELEDDVEEEDDVQEGDDDVIAISEDTEDDRMAQLIEDMLMNNSNQGETVEENNSTSSTSSSDQSSAADGSSPMQEDVNSPSSNLQEVGIYEDDREEEFMALLGEFLEPD